MCLLSFHGYMVEAKKNKNKNNQDKIGGRGGDRSRRFYKYMNGSNRKFIEERVTIRVYGIWMNGRVDGADMTYGRVSRLEAIGLVGMTRHNSLSLLMFVPDRRDGDWTALVCSHSVAAEGSRRL